jgi:hypothetical protein
MLKILKKKIHAKKWQHGCQWIEHSQSFIIFLMMGQSTIIATNKQINRDALQLIKLINMNHHRYPSYCKRVNQKWRWTKLRMEIQLKQWGGATCTQEHAPNKFLSSNRICFISFAQKCGLVLHIHVLNEH